jgi:hypothetical protein
MRGFFLAQRDPALRVALQRGETLDGIRLERSRAVHIPVLRI